MTRKAMIATAAGDGRVFVPTAGAVLEAIQLCALRGLFLSWRAESLGIYLPIVRNRLVDAFLKSDAEDLIFVDADVDFPPDALLRLLDYDVDIVAGATPFKQADEGYPVTLAAKAGEPVPVDPKTGLIAAEVAPTGFMRIRRGVFERMAEHYGADELRVVEYSPRGDECGAYLNFFDTPKVGTRWFGEDTWFCRQWRAMGGDIWVDPDITFKHWGVRATEGNFHTYLRKQPGGDLHTAKPRLNVSPDKMEAIRGAKQALDAAFG